MFSNSSLIVTDTYWGFTGSVFVLNTFELKSSSLGSYYNTPTAGILTGSHDTDFKDHNLISPCLYSASRPEEEELHPSGLREATFMLTLNGEASAMWETPQRKWCSHMHKVNGAHMHRLTNDCVALHNKAVGADTQWRLQLCIVTHFVPALTWLHPLWQVWWNGMMEKHFKKSETLLKVLRTSLDIVSHE